MKNYLWAVSVAVGVAIFSAGCSEKTDANSQLEKATREMGSAPPAAAQVAPQPAAAPTPATPTEAPPPAPAQEMKQAMVAYKAGQLEDAVTRLQRLRATPVMSPQQRMALNDAMGAVMTEIYALAAKGDSRAQQAVKQYEKMQTGGH
jgi:hypothetical protein